nr:dicarboxylate/amino acid:cation symporter [Marinilactibacillus kalidii]
MLTKIVIAVFIGVGFGFLFPEISGSLKLVGDIFLRLIQMAIPVLILGQIIQAVGSIEFKELTSLGGKTIVVFLVTSLLAAVWGIIVALVFDPGSGITLEAGKGAAIEAQELSITETVLGFFPKNIFDSLSQGSIVQIIVFALFFGVALNRYLNSHPESQLLNLFVEFNEVIIQLIRYVMVLAPIGIFALIASTISTLGGQIIIPLLKYLLVYGIGTFSFLIISSIILAIFCQVSPIKLTQNMKNISVMALATTSSAITLPLSMAESQNRLGVSKRISNLVLPLGMSLNSTGSAMHMAITVITIAQIYQVSFDAQMMIYLAITATFVSLANAVVPGAGLVSLAIIVPQMGLPIESIAVFAGVEWFVGMLRTILNVNLDVFTAVYVAKSVDELDYTIFAEK